jgi:hypothetical protein
VQNMLYFRCKLYSLDVLQHVLRISLIMLCGWLSKLKFAIYSKRIELCSNREPIFPQFMFKVRNFNLQKTNNEITTPKGGRDREGKVKLNFSTAQN